MAKTYRPEIDGLRALAVVPVVLFHSGVTAISGGFLGVDVFFVISGFLITGIIASDLEKGRFSIVNFYERRARRILPALFVVLAASLPFAWLWLFPDHMVDFGQGLIGTASFLSNYVFWHQSGYFESAAEIKPLIHTWTLAVEEQFYVLFPLFLLLIWRLGRKTSFWLIALVFLASLLLAEYGARHHPALTFYSLPTRAFELAIGSLAALHTLHNDEPFSPGTRRPLSIAGLALIILSYFTIDKETVSPGFYSLMPTVGATLVIMCTDERTLVYRILSWKPLVGIGLISYSVYLWHQPLFAFARHASVREPSHYVMAALSLASFALAYLSWRFVEQPFRDKKRTSRRFIFTFSGIGLLTFAAIGGAIVLTRGVPGRFGPEYDAIWSVQDNWRDGDACAFQPPFRQDRIERCASQANVLYLLGDSHAASLSKPLRELARANGLNLVSLTNNACLPIPGTAPSPASAHSDCTRFQQIAFDTIRKHPAPVVLLSRWRLHMTGEGFDNGEGGVEFKPGERFESIADPARPILEVTTSAIAELARQVPVIVIGQIPEAGWDVPWFLAKQRREGSADRAPLSTDYARYLRANAATNAAFGELGGNVTFIDPSRIVCSPATSRCVNERDGAPLYRDDDHPSPKFARLIAQQVIATLRPRAR